MLPEPFRVTFDASHQPRGGGPLSLRLVGATRKVETPEKKKGVNTGKKKGETPEKRKGKIEKSTQNGLRKSGQNIRNPYQTEDNKPQGSGAKRRPLGAPPKAPPCCLPFGKDFQCFGLISGAHSGRSVYYFSMFFQFFAPFCRFRQVGKKLRRHKN